MAYNETYVADDIDNAVVDLLVTVAVVLVPFGALIGLVILYKWFTGRKHVRIK